MVNKVDTQNSDQPNALKSPRQVGNQPHQPLGTPPGKKTSLLQIFYNLPISRKQSIALITCELISILGVGIGATLIITSSLRTQLLNEAKAELAISEVTYNLKVNQMGFGFRGQSDNPAIIEAAQTAAKQQNLSLVRKAQIKKILQNEVKARKIEYATLVGKDLKIIVNANADRQGEVFNPGNLVAQVLKNPTQLKVNTLVNWSELSKELPPLPSGFTNQDALIRYTITPVQDPNTKETIGALVSGDIVNGKLPIVSDTLNATGNGYSAVYSRKTTGEFSLATALDQGKSQNLNQAQPNVDLEDKSILTAAVAAKGKAVISRLAVGKQSYTIAAIAIANKILEEADGPRSVFDSQPVAVLVRGTPETTLNNSLQQSFIQQAITVLIALGVVSLSALILRRAIIRPIEELQQTAQKFASGDRTVRAQIFSSDEVGQLADTFNKMADNITNQSFRQANESKIAQLTNEITSRVRESLNSDQILNAAVNHTREAIPVERVFISRCEPTGNDTIVAASIDSSWQSIGSHINNFYFAPEYMEQYSQGKIIVNNDIHTAGLNNYQIAQLEQLDIKANIIIPILVNKQLYGLLVAHQCSSPRQWQEIEINLFQQVATQVGFALEQANLLAEVEQARQAAETVSREQRRQKETLQTQLMQMLTEVESASQGNLTVRADVTAGEIGIVADFFNSIIESLRLIVTKVKTSATQVSSAVGSNDEAIRALASNALQQAALISQTLNSIAEMTISIQTVAESARQAATVAHTASQTAEAGGKAMDLTVQNIMHLRETVSTTAKKVQRLGESSQEISRVVALINQIAMQTNVLAINAGIEAARAGEEGQGFTVVAVEIGELAARAAAATQEITHVVENIQRETSEVVEAMEQGTSQVVEGTRIVEDAKRSLSQILDVSRQIDALVQSISSATVSQVQTSQTVTTSMKEIAKVSERTSNASRQVSQSLQETVGISQELQATVDTFKVN